MRQVKTVIFDFDGTLADSFPTVVNIFNKFAEEKNLTPIFGKDIEKIKNYPLKELIIKSGIPKLQLLFIFKNWKKELAKYVPQLKPFPEIPQLIQDLKKEGYQLGIITSNSKENVEEFLKLNKLEYFDFVKSENGLFGKGGIIKKCIKELKLEKDQTIYIGDDIRDIEAARQAEIKVISVTWGYNSKKLLEKYSPNYLVEKPDQLTKILL